MYHHVLTEPQGLLKYAAAANDYDDDDYDDGGVFWVSEPTQKVHVIHGEINWNQY